MQGLHLTADLRGCPVEQPAFTDPEALRALCLSAIQRCGLTAVSELFHRFAHPGGVTGVVLLAESHLALHTWPELGAVTLDVYVCNLRADHSAPARELMDFLQAAFDPVTSQRQELLRGTPLQGQAQH